MGTGDAATWQCQRNLNLSAVGIQLRGYRNPDLTVCSGASGAFYWEFSNDKNIFPSHVCKYVDHACRVVIYTISHLQIKKDQEQICEGFPAETYKLECVDSSLQMSCEDFLNPPYSI